VILWRIATETRAFSADDLSGAGAAKAPGRWNAAMEPVKFGSDRLASLHAPILVLPSVIVPEESIVLINPRHPAAVGITARTLRRFEYGPLFRRAASG